VTFPHISLHNGCDRIHRNERKELKRRSGGAEIGYIKGEIPGQLSAPSSYVCTSHPDAFV
jgi:hypothetical protein